MKLIIAGSRTIYLYPDTIEALVLEIEDHENPFDEIVLGGAKGIDTSGEHFVRQCKMKKKLFLADWDKHGKAAGPIRNKEMAEYADALLLIWDGESKGSSNMKQEMLNLNKPIYEIILRGWSNGGLPGS